MQINHEIKSQLAKLLATEDLIVENKKVETAQFDVHNRVLTLPQWEKASNNVYDALVSHEVGHALYTPDREWFKEVQIPQQYVNVCEDIRIEKLMKRRYAGLTKTFFTGYHELSDDDFFNLADEDVDAMGLADRINIDAKIGHWNDVHFTEKEKEIRSLIHNTETFDDVLKVSQILFDYCKAEMEELQKLNEELAKVNMEMEGSGNNNMEDTETSDSPEEDVEDDKTDASKDSPDQPTQGQTTSTAPQGGAENDPTPQVKTVESLENSLKELNSLESSETEYFEIPKIKLDNLIIRVTDSADARDKGVLIEGDSGAFATILYNDSTDTWDFNKPINADLPNEIKLALNIQPNFILKSRDYLLVYNNEQEIKALKIDRSSFDKINLGHGGVIATASGNDVDFVSRFFTPQATILEDPVTGSAHCSLIPYWAAILSKNKIAINVGALVGHHTIRRHSLEEMKKEVPNKNELEKMANLLIEGMESGCLGLSTGLVYEPGRYSVSNEIIELAKKIQKYDGVYVSHMRNEAEGLIESIIETANIGLEANVKVEISHLKSVGKNNWGKSEQALDLIEKFSDDGLDINMDQYPYTARSTMLKALLLNDTFNYENDLSPMGKSMPNEVLLCSVPNEKSFEGKTLEDIQKLYDLPIIETVNKLLDDVSDKILVAAFGMNENDVQNIMKNDLTMIGTDGIDVGSKPCLLYTSDAADE